MNIRRLFDVLLFQNQERSQQVSLAHKMDNQWKTYSTEEVVKIANQLSTGLLKAGISPGEKIGLVSLNRPEWVIVDFAISQIGAINVPMYPNSTAEDYAYIINDATVKMVFAGDDDLLTKLKKTETLVNHNISLFSFDQGSDKYLWTNLLKDEIDHETIETLRSKIEYEDLATIIYTSGTTGNPKGVMLSHKNILSNTAAVTKAFATGGPEHTVLSFLPLSHIFERTALYVYLHMGASIYFAESMDTIAENMREVKPHFFATVPRLLEKVYEKILVTGYELQGVKKNLFFWALNLAKKYDLDNNQGFFYNLQLTLANKIIFSKWRAALGGRVEFIVSGGAALQPRLANIFWAAQIKVLEAYGLTETSPGISFSLIDDLKVGCVGPLLDGIQVKIATDGEVLVKGDNVMMGYYKRQDLTDEVIDNDGWFHTGDIGEMVDNHYLKITDRKKEMFKTSGGKYIAPQALENKFGESLLIDQIMIVGEGQKFPGALIVPNFEKLRTWCQHHNVNYTTDDEMIKNSEVVDKFEREIASLNESFAQYEKIKKFRLLPQHWTIENGEVTPKLSLKRKIIKKNHQSVIDSIYS
ncbi:AMP-dependent synthetase/ligase [Fulvivirga sediminis]|uniref:Long-chain fatty acid--CoA ligase n=1 Tax=Fulvivirga sediminis TaxID=2803949 RepID=A0A937JWG6_9BACT|nr:long-chain fatty acid--CoA ligase [Fulvivirga sediminis]MBL3654533.1 long-chain fatty acid--CoA ligase [Fulvivirga sediminis]